MQYCEATVETVSVFLDRARVSQIRARSRY